MSTRINLYFRSYPDLELIEQNIVLAYNTVPLIIGFESLLKQADVSLSFTRNTAYLDFP